MKTPTFFDIGVNLTSSQFDKDRDDILTRAKNAAVHNMLLIGSNLDDSLAASQQAAHYQLVSSAGVHPHDAKSVNDGFCKQLKPLLALSHVVAVGECGLDYNRDFSPRPQQRKVFEQQVLLANQLSKPLYMHERDAHDDFYAIAQQAKTQGVVHCFTGDQAALKRYLDLGFYIGITGWVCDERRGLELRELIQYIPCDRLMIETDAPYLLPRTIKPKPKSRRNEPAMLPWVAQTIAELKQTTVESVMEQTHNNAISLFMPSGGH